MAAPVSCGAGNPVAVCIVAATSTDQPQAWRLSIEIDNETTVDVWIDDDGFLTFRRDGDKVRLSLARGRMTAGAVPFGYFAPAMVRLPAGETMRRELDLGWPLALSTLWHPERRAALPTGEYRVTVEIGYAFDAAPPPPSGEQSVEDAVLAWQNVAVSDAVSLAIAPQDA